MAIWICVLSGQHSDRILSLVLQGYRYTMRPLPLCKPKKQAEKDSKEGNANEPQPVSTAGAKPSETDGPSHSSTVQEVRLQVIAGQAVGLGGRALPTLFPPFPNVSTAVRPVSLAAASHVSASRLKISASHSSIGSLPWL